MRRIDVRNGKPLLIEKRPQFASFSKRCRLREYLAMMGSPFACN